MQSTATLRRRRLPSWLVAAEVALALALLVGAGLLLRSLQAVYSVPSGMNTQHVLVARLPLNPLLPKERRKATDRVILQRVRQLPGVETASLASVTPFQGRFNITPYRPAGADPGMKPVAALPLLVDGGYLRALHIRLMRGRFFDDRDRSGGAPVVIISRSLAERLWPGRDPIGRQLAEAPVGGAGANPVVRTVVGVVADTRMLGLRASILPSVYLPYQQSNGITDLWLILRSRQAPDRLAAEVRKAVLAVAPDQPLADVMTMEQRLDESVSSLRFPGILLGTFAALAILLACLGIYGVLSHFVARQAREIGIRLVLGAGRAEVFRFVLRQGAAPVLSGVSLGLAVAFALGRYLSSLLFHVRPYDPGTIVTGTTILASVAFLAIFLPAWRACRSDPAEILRQE